VAQSNHLNVQVYPARDAAEFLDEPLEFINVHYISLVSDQTYGIPALITDHKVKDEGLPVRILYINPANVAAFLAERVS
jgi:hypothetical protein